MTDSLTVRHDINCELKVGHECQCNNRDAQRQVYGLAKNDAQDSLDSLIQQASARGSSEVQVAERTIRRAIQGYPTCGQVAQSPVECNASEEEINRLTQVLLAAWTRAEPSHVVTLYPASYVTTFADMARAVLADQSNK